MTKLITIIPKAASKTTTQIFIQRPNVLKVSVTHGGPLTETLFNMIPILRKREEQVVHINKGRFTWTFWWFADIINKKSIIISLLLNSILDWTDSSAIRGRRLTMLFKRSKSSVKSPVAGRRKEILWKKKCKKIQLNQLCCALTIENKYYRNQLCIRIAW